MPPVGRGPPRGRAGAARRGAARGRRHGGGVSSARRRTERPASSYRRPPTAGSAPKSGRRRRPTFWRELPILVVVALVLTFLIQTFLAKVYVIPSGSMETTLHGCTGCVNDRVLVDKITYRFRDPQPGDVVVFRGPDSWRSEFTVEEPTNPLLRGLQGLGSLIGLAPPDEKDFVKRVIAVGGQTVACCDPRNRVLVDEQPLEEPYIYYLPDAGPARQAPFGPVTVPAGELWMMGDSPEQLRGLARARPRRGADLERDRPGPDDRMPFDRFGRIASVDPHANAVGMAAGYGRSCRPPWACSRRCRCCAAAAPSALRGAAGCTGARARRPRHLTRSTAMTARSARRAPLPPEWRPSRAVVRRSSGTWTLQSTLHRHGLGPVAGVDEAGRGACAGPLVAAAVRACGRATPAARRAGRLQAAHRRRRASGATPRSCAGARLVGRRDRVRRSATGSACTSRTSRAAPRGGARWTSPPGVRPDRRLPGRRARRPGARGLEGRPGRGLHRGGVGARQGDPRPDHGRAGRGATRQYDFDDAQGLLHRRCTTPRSPRTGRARCTGAVRQRPRPLRRGSCRAVAARIERSTVGGRWQRAPGRRRAGHEEE